MVKILKGQKAVNILVLSQILIFLEKNIINFVYKKIIKFTDIFIKYELT